MKNAILILLAVMILPVSARNRHEEDYEQYVVKTNRPYILRLGMGLGYRYGGIFGVGLEGGSQYFTLTGGVGIFLNQIGWSVGPRVYLIDDRYAVRPSISVVYGPVYIYHVEAGSVYEGTVNGFTPMICIQHSLGEKKFVSLTYGVGAWIRQDIKASDRDIVEEVLGEQRAGFTGTIGVNINFESF